MACQVFTARIRPSRVTLLGPGSEGTRSPWAPATAPSALHTHPESRGSKGCAHHRATVRAWPAHSRTLTVCSMNKTLVHLPQRRGSPCLCSCYSSSTGLQPSDHPKDRHLQLSAEQDPGSCWRWWCPHQASGHMGYKVHPHCSLRKTVGEPVLSPWVSNCSPPLEPWWAMDSALPPSSGFQGKTKGLRKKGKSSLTTASDNCFKIY